MTKVESSTNILQAQPRHMKKRLHYIVASIDLSICRTLVASSTGDTGDGQCHQYDSKQLKGQNIQKSTYILNE